MTGSLSIRQYAADDLAACRALWAELTDWHRDLYDDPTIGGDDPGRAFDAHLERAGASGIFVAEAAGEVVGLAGLLVEDGKAELEPVVVTAQWRGRGVGRLLAEAVIAAAGEADARRLVVRPVGRNRDAIRFFHALGFDSLTRVDLQLDFMPRPKRPGERLAGRDFLV